MKIAVLRVFYFIFFWQLDMFWHGSKWGSPYPQIFAIVCRKSININQHHLNQPISVGKITNFRGEITIFPGENHHFSNPNDFAHILGRPKVVWWTPPCLPGWWAWRVCGPWDGISMAILWTTLRVKPLYAVVCRRNPSKSPKWFCFENRALGWTRSDSWNLELFIFLAGEGPVSPSI